MQKINENAPTLFAKSKARAEKEERLQRLNGERKPGLGAPPTQSKKQSVGVHAMIVTVILRVITVMVITGNYW